MRLLAVSSLVLAAPVFAQQFPESEPNNTAATAQAFALGQQCNANLVAAEEDWYTFTTPGGYHLITAAGGETAGTDLTMTLFDAAGTTPLAFNDDSVSLVPALNLTLLAGTYTIRIRGFSGTTTGVYSLDISLPIAKPYTGTESEPNDTLATANVVTDGAQLLSSLTPPVALLSDAVAAPVVVASYVVGSATATVLTPTVAPANTPYSGVGYFVRFTSGVHSGLSRRLSTNAATTFTTETWGTAAAAGDTFDVVTSSPTVLADVAAAGSTTTVLNTTAVLVASAYIAPTSSHAVRFLTGANAGLSRTITANTASSITTAAWPAAPTAGDSYVIVAGGTTNVVVPATPLAAGLLNDQRHWLRCTSGTNVGLSRCILSNTAQVITLVNAFSNAPAPGDTFTIDQYDSDTYRIDVTAPKAEVVFSVTEGTAPWVSAFSYEVLDSLGVRIPATLGTGLADSPTAAPEGRVSSFRVWPTGTYYVRIFKRRSPQTNPDDDLVLFGNYRFEVKIRDMNTLGTVAETEPVGGPQSNNTAATAIAIAPGQQGFGNITISSGADASDLWGPITFSAQSLMTFQITAGATATPLADASILLRQLLDPVTGALSAGTSVTGGNVLEAGSLNPRGVFNFLLPGTTYYLEVLSPGTAANQGGDYVLELSTVDSPTYSAGNWAQVAANASGCGTAGVPTISRVMGQASGTYGELPLIGQTLTTRVTNLNGIGNFGLLVLGTSGVLGPSGAPAGTPESVYNPQPLDLGIFGATGCALIANPFIVEVMFGSPTGVADYALACPGDPALAGFTLFMQPCKWDFTINALGIQPGNWARVIFGRRTF